MPKINGDTVCSLHNRLRYFIQCIRDHSKGSSHPIKIIAPELNGDLSELWLTPTRVLCNAFWRSVDYRFVGSSIGAPLHFLDLGCGAGVYGEIFKRHSGDAFGSYTGLDIYLDPAFPKQYQHILARAEDAVSHLDKDMNLVISQSALEHIEHDLIVVRSLTARFVRQKKSFMQIHLVPGASSLWLYLWHGWRQYSKRRLSQWGFELKNEFDANIAIVPIGGIRCFAVHLICVTLPVYGAILLSYVLPPRLVGGRSKNRVVSTTLRRCAVSGSVGSGSSPVFWAFIVSSKNIDPTKLFANAAVNWG